MATVTPRRRPSAKKTQDVIDRALLLARHAARFSDTDLWMSFDREADVLYISLKKPQQATDTIHLDDQGILLHYRGKEMVGITVLDASKR